MPGALRLSLDHKRLRHTPEASRRAAVVQLESGWLVPGFQHSWIMLHDIDGPQLGMALELNGPAHFATGIPTMNITPSSRYTANRR
jgi:hypothetical protein